MRIYGIVSPVSTLLSKAGTGDINTSKLFGTTGDDGLVIQTDFSKCRKSLDGTQVVFKTNSGESREGEADALQYCLTRAEEEGLTVDLYSAVPCELVGDVYQPLADATDWASSVLTSIHTEMATLGWTDPDNDT